MGTSNYSDEFKRDAVHQITVRGYPVREVSRRLGVSTHSLYKWMKLFGEPAPKSHGKPRVDDRRVLSGIIFINRNGLRWSDAPKEYGPPKTLYNRWKRWSDMGVFARIMVGLASEATDRKTIMIDATYLKAPRSASSLG